MIRKEIVVIIDKEDYQHISDALELARRYIKQRQDKSRGVDEFSGLNMKNINEAMGKYWNGGGN